MTRTGGVTGKVGRRPADPELPGGRTGAEGLAGDGLAGDGLGVDGVGVDGVGVDGVAVVRAMREALAVLPVPGVDDDGSGEVEGVPAEVQARWVDMLGELEAVKSAVTATQARLAVALDQATRADEERGGVRRERRGRGVPGQVGTALRISPRAGGGFVSTARVWVTLMPHTFAALQAGILSPWRAGLLVRETSHLSPEHRGLVDEQLCGPGGREALAGLGTRRVVAGVEELAARWDVHACLKRNAKAVGERRVSLRPAPDLMVYLTALVPMVEGVQAYAQLKADAEAIKAAGQARPSGTTGGAGAGGAGAGEARGVGQIMADTLVERVTGRGPGEASQVPVTVNLLVSDRTLLAGGGDPGVVVEGAAGGAGVVPAPVARSLVAGGIDAGAAWLRSIYVSPRGRLLATSSTSRFFPPGLSALLRAREQGICAMPWCDAPVRHLDHVTPHAQGGVTSLGNGQGLCAGCNHGKQAPGWVQKCVEVEGRHGVETRTPTGHTYVTVAPTPPAPVQDPAWTPAVGLTGPA